MTEPIAVPDAAPPALAARCRRHPATPATGACARCGDFACPACLAASPVCPGCLEREAARPRPRGFFLWAAVVTAVLAGVGLIGVNVLAAAVSGATGVTAWNCLIGVTYFAIAAGLYRRSPAGVSWSLWTQGLNALLRGRDLYLLIEAGDGHPVAFAFVGGAFAVHALGWLFTFLARGEAAPRKPA